MEKNKGWYLFHDWIDVLKRLEKDAAWDIIVAIDEYYLTGKDPTQAVKSIEQQVIVTMMHQQIQRLENVSAKRKSAGQAGGVSKAQNVANCSKSKQNVAKVSKSKQNLANCSKGKQSVATYTYTNTITDTNTNTDTTLTCGIYDNVTLSQSDLEKLKKEFPNDYEERIDRLSEYMESSGKTYKNHLATIRNWARREAAAEPQEANKGGSFDTDDFFEAAIRRALGEN